MNSLVRKASLPNRQPRMKPMRETSLDQLNSSFEGKLDRWSDERVKMIGHDDEFMQKIFTLGAIVQQRLDE